MFKKAVWSIVLIAIVGVLIYGAVNRTLAKTIDVSPEPAAIAANNSQTTDLASAQGRQSQNTAPEALQGQSNGRSQNRQAESNREDFGEAEQPGQGYGRQDRNTTSDTGVRQSQGNGRGQNRQAGQAGAGSAEAVRVDMAWQTVQGEVVSLAPDAMIVETATGASVLIAGRPWSYIQESGFVVEPGDKVTLNGFEENGEFRIGELANDASGQLVQIREYSGRPLWAGGGQGRSR